MKIGVVSDTHSIKVPPQLVIQLKAVDLIVHTGDFCSLKDLEFFEKIKKVEAVCGNMDDKELCQRLGKKKIIKCEDVTIGLTHGHGPAKDVLANVKKEFENDKVDIVMFGHSHQALNQMINKTLFFNAGSPTDMVRASYRSYGIIEIIGRKIVPKIFKLED